ncbi:MAG TPA: hypothetical protein VGN23_02920 [Verrucomicrobiae bacterium]|jgi:hypothetical protein
MKYLFTAGLAVTCTCSVFADATSTASVNAALAKLEAAANYSWTVNVQIPNSQFTPAPVTGSVGKDGYSLVTGQDFNGDSAQVVFKGEKGDKIAVKGQDAWQDIGSADQGAAMMGGILVNRGTPAAEAERLLKDAGDLSAGTNGVISGDLTSAGATDMMTFPSRNGSKPPPPKDSKGSVKFWLNADGSLAKFESHLDGKVAFGPGQDPQDFEIIRTVEIHDVGTAKVSIPDDAIKAMQGKSAASP